MEFPSYDAMKAEESMTVEFVTTRDRAHIALKRRPAAGPPVILLHGLAVHSELWDAPRIVGRDFEFRGFASVLQDAGHDVWLANFRGHGGTDAFSRPPEGQRDWNVDHFILFDLPAVVEHVRRRTHQRPFVIGVSMGAMTLGAYLEGARLEGERLERAASPEAPVAALEEDASLRVVVDPELARARQAELRGCVFVTYPAALRWPRSIHSPDGRLNWRELVTAWTRRDFDTNYPFELLARWGWLEAALAAAGEIPLDWLRSDGPARLRLSPAVSGFLERTEKAFLAGLLKVKAHLSGADNHKVEIVLYGRKHVIESMKAGVLRQMARSIRARGFVSALGTPDVVYSDHYGLIELPVLVLAGARDRIANPLITREAFHDVIRSPDKEFMVFEPLGHGEFTISPFAADRVFPEMVRWIGERCGAS